MDNYSSSSSGWVVPNGTDQFNYYPFLQSIIDSNPVFFGLSINELNAASQQQNDPSAVQQDNVPFPDPMTQHQPFEAGPSTQGNQTPPANENMDAMNGENVISLGYWPPPPVPFSCTCCQVLRQIIHADAIIRIDRLEIHGAVGVITHAISHVREITPGGGPSIDSYKMIDFCSKSTEQIRNFLKDYCEEKTNLGLINMDDPLSAFYDALSTGLDWTEDSNDEDDDLRPNGTEEESESESEPEPEPEPENGNRPRRNMAVQRQRVPKMTLSDLGGVFHLTLKAASGQLDISDSALKKICRKADLLRWPQRKIQSLAKKAKILQKALDSEDPGVRRRAQVEIQRLQQEIIQRCGGVTPTGIEMLQFQG